MGFNIRRSVVLDLSGTVLDGAQITMRTCNSETFSRIWADGVTVEDQQRLVAEHLLSWNLADGDEDLPTDIQGVSELDPAQWLCVLGAWGKSMRDVSAPLERRSGVVDTSPAASMSMETL